MNWKRCILLLCAALCFSQTPKHPPSAKAAKQSTSSLEKTLDQLTEPSPGQVVPNPNRYDPAKIEAVNELHDYQIKDLMARVGNLESTRTWIIGLTAGLGIGIALIIWLRKDIVRSLVIEAFPSDRPRDVGPEPARWHPSTSQWFVLWTATLTLSALCLFVPGSLSLSLRLGLVLVGNAILLLLFLARR
jgi:hypothetical protein